MLTSCFNIAWENVKSRQLNWVVMCNYVEACSIKNWLMVGRERRAKPRIFMASPSKGERFGVDLPGVVKHKYVLFEGVGQGTKESNTAEI